MNQIQGFWAGLQNVFGSFQPKDVFDILLVAIIIYCVIKLVRETRAGQLVKGIILVVVIWVLSGVFQLYMMNTILTYIVQYGIVCVFVVFQPEIRSALERMGRGGKHNLFHLRDDAAGMLRRRRAVSAVVDACAGMSKSKTGALIVFERETKLGDVIETGTILNAVPSVPLIGNLFFNKAPLHDGAVIIRDGMVYAAGCILPLTKRNSDVAIELGTRHRAGIGMSENSDAVVVIVSEETGQISIALGGTITRNFTRESLQGELANLLLEPEDLKSKGGFFASLWRNKNEK